MQYTIEQVKEATKTSLSIRQTLIKLGRKPRGGNYKIVKRLIEKYKIDISHMLGKNTNKGRKFNHRTTLNDLLVNGKSYSSHKLRIRLIEENIFNHQCNLCKNTHWLSELIPLELDHIDGNHDNNELSNLQLLCPNCHAKTPNYRGKNKKRYSIEAPLDQSAESWNLKFHKSQFESGKEHREIRVCKKHEQRFCSCGLAINSRSKQCISCYNVNRSTKIEWPTIPILLERLKTTNFSKLAIELGVSDNAIRKRLRAFDIAL